MNNQECEAKTKIIDINTNKPVFYPYSIKVNKCSGSCNNINDPYAKLCVPDVIKNINVKVFNLISRINETRHIIWHETCKCICRLSASVSIVGKDGKMTNADVNVKNKLTKEYVIKDSSLTQVPATVINHAA